MNSDSNNITVRAAALTTGYHDRQGNRVISDRLDDALRSGELTCLLGPNGAGKSTLLRTLAGFQKPLGGSVEIMGRDITACSDRDLARTISVVLTEKPLLENMDAQTLVELGRAPYTGFWGRLSRADHSAVEQAIALTGIEPLRHRMVQTLSDGERQKVMIAKALAQQTPIILLDEPTAFLDYPSKVEIMQLLFRLSRTGGKTIFLSTHDLELALQLADRVWLIDRRLGVATGTPEDLSLSGTLGRYFVRPGIVFDPADGLFRIDVPMRAEVNLTGSGDMLNMVRKALFRNGIRGTADARSDVRIIASPEGISVNGRACASVAAMLASLPPLPGDKPGMQP